MDTEKTDLPFKDVWQLSKEVSPALAVFFFSIAFAFFFDNFILGSAWSILIRAWIRFLRFAFFLCLPLYVLLPICTVIGRKVRNVLVQTESREEPGIHPVKHWLFRPFQGIGIGLLFETKLLGALQIITGETAKPSLLFFRGHFEPGRMLVISGITVIVSLFLASLWTFDDLGIRYINRKNQELKMIGKYIGTLMPILFGFYGVFSLLDDYPAGLAVSYLFKTALILYPSFTFLSVLHSHFLRKRAENFFQKVSLVRGGIWHG